MEFITNSPAETESVGAKLAEQLNPGAVIAYKGDLGAGKTAFTRGLARGLGILDPVTIYHCQRVFRRTAAAVSF